MPWVSYGDKFTHSVSMRNHEEEEQDSVMDLSSKVLDWVVVEDTVSGAHSSLLILNGEELVCVDLANAGWPSVSSPYM